MVGKALHMEGYTAARLVFKVNADGVAHIGTNDQRAHFLIGLGDRKLKPLPCLPLDALGILLEHIQQPIGVVVAEAVVYDGKRDCFYMIDPELSGVRIS